MTAKFGPSSNRAKPLPLSRAIDPRDINPCDADSTGAGRPRPPKSERGLAVRYSCTLAADFLKKSSRVRLGFQAAGRLSRPECPALCDAARSRARNVQEGYRP